MNSMKHLEIQVAACLEAAEPLLHPSQRSSIGMPGEDAHGVPLTAPRKLAWCNGWQFPCDKLTIKYSSSPYMVKLQRWLAENSSTGLLTRQEVVSMIPAALLDIQPWHKCLDLCASPGSKTTQLLEGLHSSQSGVGYWESQAAGAGDMDMPPPPTDPAAGADNDDGAAWMDAPTGVVVANDFSPARAYLLVRRCAALGLATSRLIIAVHAAQRFPNTVPPMCSSGNGGSSGEGRYPAGQYDRVLCDVPCSGDGTLRKNPESWASWGPDYGTSLHVLQMRIALRGLALLRVGGLMAYSTCSFNPVEDEAVVAELLRRCRGAVELVDASGLLPSLRRRSGMSSWTVMDDDGMLYPTYADSQAAAVSPARRAQYRPSMWPRQAQPEEHRAEEPPPLSRCLRFMPHLQDTGGFFVAILRKTAPLPGPPGDADKAQRRSGAGSSAGCPAGGATSPGDSHSARQAHVPVDEERLAALKRLFGLKGKRWQRLAKRLFWRVGGGAHRSITYVADSLNEEFLSTPGAPRMKQVMVGSKLLLWEAQHGRHLLRLTPEGAELLRPLASRRVFALAPPELAELLRRVNSAVPLRSLSEAAARAVARREAEPGPCIWALEGDASVAVPGELLADGGGRVASAAVRYPFVRGREHAPKASARALLRHMGMNAGGRR